MQRKVFRVEQMFAGRRNATARNVVQHDAQIDELKKLRALADRRGGDTRDADKLRRELEAIQASVARNRRELAALNGIAGEERRLLRANGELGAAIEGMEKATQKILKSTEVIDESARALTATLKDEFKRGLAQDIQDQAVAIYEACNFQDLAGQRIAKAMATLQEVERHVARMIDLWGGVDVPAVAPARSNELLNGPRLDGDSGHADQDEIDRMFG